MGRLAVAPSSSHIISLHCHLRHPAPWLEQAAAPPGLPADGRMGLRNTARVEAVKRLREVAARLGVARAPDNAGRQKVEAMRQAILAASALADADRPEVESAWNAYLSTWADQEAVDGAAAPGGAGAGADGGPAKREAVEVPGHSAHVQLQGRGMGFR